MGGRWTRPWQVPRDRWAPAGDGSEVDRLLQRVQRLEHRTAVRAALADGQPVPPEVMADYPELRRR